MARASDYDMTVTMDRTGKRFALMVCAICTIATGCAGGSDRYPSLAVRDAERIQGTFEPVDSSDAVTKPRPAPPGQQSQLNALLSEAGAVHADFMESVPAAQDLILAIDETGPENKAWGDAQVALAALESRRSQAAIALGDMDLLYANASADFVERREIDAARQQVIALIEQEDAILAELRRQISQ